MPKFYVQCGPIEVVLLASCPEQAAMAALDRSMQSHLWIYDDAGLTDSDRLSHLMLEALFHLDPTVRVSEQGFDREDATQIGTPDTVESWHHLMTGMNQLFIAAGLPPRNMSALAESTSDVRLPRMPR